MFIWIINCDIHQNVWAYRKCIMGPTWAVWYWLTVGYLSSCVYTVTPICLKSLFGVKPVTCFSICQVTIPALNDSKLIGLSVYNVIILCAIGLGVSFALGDDPGSLFLFISCITLFCTSATLIVIFVPKVRTIIG